MDADGVIANHTYSSPGTYNVTLKVTNTGGLTHASAFSLTVAAKPAIGLIGWLQSPTGMRAHTHMSVRLLFQSCRVGAATSVDHFRTCPVLTTLLDAMNRKGPNDIQREN